MSDRAALLINCSKDEAKAMHDWARVERRTLSGHVLSIVMHAVRIDETLGAQLNGRQFGPLVWPKPTRVAGPRTTVLVRCSADESRRIRSAAARKDTSISGFVLQCLQRSWTARLNTRLPGVDLPWRGDRTHTD
jgi:uncharacterized protein (DUF1778 family)